MCTLCTGSRFEVKTEADSSDVTECSDDNKPTIGMFVFSVAVQSFIGVIFSQANLLTIISSCYICCLCVLVDLAVAR